MYPTHQFKDKFVLFLKIFFPILIYQFANYSASFVDTTMTGQYNTMDLAGVSTGTSLWNAFFTFLTGIVSAMVPIIGHHLGRGKKEEVASDFYQFIYLAFALSLGVDFDCYLIDEVISVGDASFHKKCEVELFEKRAHKAMIIVSHELHNIRDYCDRAAILDKGRLFVFDDIEEAMSIYNNL